jgi:hypothetical protein
MDNESLPPFFAASTLLPNNKAHDQIKTETCIMVVERYFETSLATLDGLVSTANTMPGLVYSLRRRTIIGGIGNWKTAKREPIITFLHSQAVNIIIKARSVYVFGKTWSLSCISTLKLCVT